MRMSARNSREAKNPLVPRCTALADYTLPDRSIRRRLVRGYDPEAVDQYLAQLAREAAAAGLRTLPALPASGGHHVRSLNRAEWRQYGGERHAERRHVGDLPGLRLRRTGSYVKVTGEVTGSSGEVLLTRRRRNHDPGDRTGSARGLLERSPDVAAL